MNKQSFHFQLSKLSIALLPLLCMNAYAQIPPAEMAEKTLPAVQVKASADASAEGLQAPYAGGQVAKGGRVGMFGQQDNMSTPFTITSYTQELIQNQQAASVGEVLINDPAVRVARGFGNFQQVYIVRGLPVFSDDMSYNGLYGLLPRQYLASEFLERVEILRGANTFLNGAAPGGSGLGGAVNVVPKRAGNDPVSQVTVGSQTGGQGYIGGDVGRRFSNGKFGVRLNAARRDGDTAIDGESSELSLFSIGADYRDTNLRLSADIGYQDRKTTALQPSVTFNSGFTIPGAPDSSRSIAQPWTYSNERDTFGTLRGEYDFSKNLTGWIAAGAREGDEANSLANPTVINAAGDSSTYRFDNTRKDSVSTGEVGLRGKFATGSVGHNVSLSAATFESKSKNAYAFSNFVGFAGNIYNPSSVTAPIPNFFIGGALNNPLVTEKVKTSSVALADVLSFLQDTLLVTVGLRHQKIENYGYDYNTGAELNGYSKSAVTPVGGIVYKFTPQISGYANYIEGLVKGDTAPTTSGATPIANAGEVFEPYKTKQTEIGVKYDAGKIGGAIGVYQSRKPQAGVNGNVYGITSHQKNRGLEVSVYGEVVRNLTVLGGVSLLDSDVEGKDAIGSPKTQANVGLEWKVPQVRGLSFDGRVIYTGSQYADAANTQEIPSWTRIDLGARYLVPIGQQMLTIRGRVENVAAKNYWASSGGYPGAGYLTVGAPRTFIMSASLDF